MSRSRDRVRSFLVLPVLLALLMEGCGGGGGTPPTPPPPPPIVGDGTFRAASSPTVTTGDKPTALATGDWNGDGHQDLAVGSMDGDEVVIHLGRGDGTFTAAGSFSLPPGSAIFDLRVGRLDAGLTLDLVTANSSNGTASVFFGVGDGTFVPGPTLVVPGGDDVMGVGIADLNRDSRMDVLAVARAPGLVGVFLGNGDGTFAGAVPSTIAVTFEARNVAIGRWNGDAFPDLAVSVRDSRYVQIFLGVGDGSFQPAPGSPVAVLGRPWNMAVGDWNADGYLDLACPGDDTDDATLLLGDGAGGFAEAPSGPVPVGTAPYGIATGNFNGDGVLDLVVANLLEGTLSIRLGDGDGNFRPSPVPEIAVGSMPYATVVGDFDEDGISDIAVANQGDDTVTVLLGNPE